MPVNLPRSTSRTTGRVIALMFKESGIADPIEQDELDEAAAVKGADTMAS